VENPSGERNLPNKVIILGTSYFLSRDNSNKIKSARHLNQSKQRASALKVDYRLIDEGANSKHRPGKSLLARFEFLIAL
jgi:hypothetical protein